MDMKHQLLLDVFDVHSGDAVADAAGVMANTGDDPGIDAGVSVSEAICSSTFASRRRIAV